VSSLKRGENCEAEKVGGRSTQKTGRERERCMAERRGMLKGSGSLSRGKLHCCYRTTMVQKLDKEFLASFISSFQQGDEPH